MMRRYLVALGALLSVSSALAQCVIADFEGFAVGLNGAVLFRQPGFSGSTSGFVVTQACNIAGNVFNCSLISDEQVFNGERSLKVAWQFRVNPNTGEPYPNAWLRLTTFNTSNKPNPEISFDHKVRLRMYVPSDTPDFYLTLGVRETGSSAGCGGNGGSANGIEWIGATSAQSGPSAPVGKLINQKDQWITVSFNIRCEPIRAFAGGTANGELQGNTGTIEQLAFTPVDPAQLGPYIVYIDDVETVAVLPGDVDDNGCVDDADLLQVLFAFGSEGVNPADVNCDGVVDDADLLIVLFNFGTGC